MAATRRAAALAALVWVLLALTAPPVQAHSQLLTTVPVDGEAVPAPPDEVVLNFDEPVSPPPRALRVFDARGRQVPSGGVSVSGDGSTMRAALPTRLQPGGYVVAWRAVSADGHPVQGAFTFAVGDAVVDRAGLLARIASSGSEAGWQAAAALTRWVLYGCVLLAVGGVAFLLWVHDRCEDERRPLTRIVAVASAGAAGATVAGFLWQTVLVSGLGAAALTDAAVIAAVARSGYGVAALVRLAGLALMGLAAGRLWSPAAVLAAAAGAVSTTAAFVLTGHTAATSPRWLATAANLAHTAAGAVWFGGLVLLLVTLARRKARADASGAAAIAARFSALATIAVAAVVLGGTGLAWTEVRAARALTTTAYGVTLIGKVSLVGVVLAGGLYNHRRLVPAVTAGAQPAWGRLSRIVRLEASGIVAVLAVTAVLVNLVPARTAAGVTGFYHATVPAGERRLDVTVDPNRAGTNELHVYLLDANGLPSDAGGDLGVQFRLPAEDIGPIERIADPAGPGHWTLIGDEMVFAGQWRLTFTLPVSKFEELRASITVPVQ